MALELVTSGDEARRGYWVRVGSKFAYAVGRPTSRDAAVAFGCPEQSCDIQNCVGKSLQDVLPELAKNESDILDILGSYVGVAGEIDSTGKWMIQHSTQPELVGCNLVGSPRDEHCCSTLSDATTSPDGHQVMEQTVRLENSRVLTRKWNVMELSACDLPTTC